MEEPNNYENFNKTYSDSVKYDVENGSYFKDAYNWYCNLFLSSYSNRTFYIFMCIMGIIIIYNVVKTVSYILPIKDEIYISIKENDITKYQTDIRDLTLYSEAENSDEQILEYLVKNYVKERETHNYKTANISDMNLKLTKIRNTSSSDVFSEFKSFMSKSNTDGPYYFFGKDIETSIEITKFSFIRIVKTKLKDKIIDFFNMNPTFPIKANVYYTLTTASSENTKKEKRRALISFKYSPVEKTKDGYSSVKLVVTDYKNYIVK